MLKSSQIAEITAKQKQTAISLKALPSVHSTKDLEDITMGDLDNDDSVYQDNHEGYHVQKTYPVGDYLKYTGSD